MKGKWWTTNVQGMDDEWTTNGRSETRNGRGMDDEGEMGRGSDDDDTIMDG